MAQAPTGPTGISAKVDINPGDTAALNTQAAQAKIIEAAMQHVEAVGGNRIHFGLHFGLDI
jgi:hypothetical protein